MRCGTVRRGLTAFVAVAAGGGGRRGILDAIPLCLRVRGALQGVRVRVRVGARARVRVRARVMVRARARVRARGACRGIAISTKSARPEMAISSPHASRISMRSTW